MNRILFEEQSGYYELAKGDDRLEHVRNVLRVKEGDLLDIGVVNGPAGKGLVEKVGFEKIMLKCEWGDIPPPLPPVTLAIGLSRPQTMRKVLFEATTLGVSRILVFPGDRSDPAYAQSRLWQSGQWREYLVRAAEQAFDTRIPELEIYSNREACFDKLNTVAERWVLDVHAPNDHHFPKSRPEECAIVIGPERGWSRKEQVMFRDQGYQLFQLGPRILRVETAVVVALGLFLVAGG